MELPAGWKRVAAVGALGLVMVMLLAAAVSGGDRSVQAGVDSALTGANITLAELQAHRAAGSCWVCVHGRVLDVSAFRAKHPGGADKIACGTDLTASFQQKHGAIANLDLKLAGRFAADIRVVGMFAPVSAPPPLFFAFVEGACAEQQSSGPPWQGHQTDVQSGRSVRLMDAAAQLSC